MARLVEILALEMEEWPEGVTHLTQSNVDREIYNAFDGREEDSVDSLIPRFDTMKAHTEDVYPIVTRAQWQAERDRQKGGEWRRHRGGFMPKSLNGSNLVECKRRDGELCAISRADQITWAHSHCRAVPYRQIMSYRVISQPQAEEVKMEQFTIPAGAKVEMLCGDEWSTIGYTPDAKTDQIDGPIRWRDTFNELDAYIEEFTRERESLINRLALEGFALIPAMTAVMGVADYAPKFDDWVVGDIVEVIDTSCFCNEDVKVGDQYPISQRDDEDVKGPAGTFGDEGNYRFVSRP